MVLAAAYVQPDLQTSVLCTNATAFTEKGMFNMNNIHVWTTKHPNAMRLHAYQKHFYVND